MKNMHKATQEFYFCNAIGEQRRCLVGSDGVCDECVPSTAEAYVAQQQRRLDDALNEAHASYVQSVEGL